MSGLKTVALDGEFTHTCRDQRNITHCLVILQRLEVHLVAGDVETASTSTQERVKVCDVMGWGHRQYVRNEEVIHTCSDMKTLSS